MANKPLKKNYYKNSPAREKAQKRQQVVFCFKLIAGFILLTALSGTFIFGYDLLTQCDYFITKEITVQGATRLSGQEVSLQADIFTGDNLLDINLSTVRKRLIAHPWIAEANVSRELPDRISITVVEQEPLAIVCLGRKFIINKKGEIIKEHQETDNVSLPFIIGLEFSDINAPGEPRGNAFKSVMSVLSTGLKPESILDNKQIKRINVDREIGLTLYAFEQETAILLGYDDYPGKYEKLKKVLFYLNSRQDFADFNYIDLNHSNRIVVDPVRVDTHTIVKKEV
ncbi:MAG: FtsQ-type POTRA domain-containing protein [Desulfobacterales bacterium]|nr:FtsQ-type POTRA domain-containing protein [Desulfobacterales bacterium]